MINFIAQKILQLFSVTYWSSSGGISGTHLYHYGGQCDLLHLGDCGGYSTHQGDCKEKEADHYQ